MNDQYCNCRKCNKPSLGDDSVLKDVKAERVRQNILWGRQDHNPDRWLTILVEEVGEVAKAIQEGDKKNYREELVQVAAVAVAAIESLDRSRK